MPRLIKHDSVVDDDWERLPREATLPDVADGRKLIVPLALWQAQRDTLRARGDIGVWLAPADDPAALAADVAALPLIAIDFPGFGDGRGYSTARLLRERHGYTGELRAIGDIFRDQLFYLRECGFDAFATRSDLDPAQELAGFEAYERTYAASHRTATPWFRTRLEDQGAGQP